MYIIQITLTFEKKKSIKIVIIEYLFSHNKYSNDLCLLFYYITNIVRMDFHSSLKIWVGDTKTDIKGTF